MRKEKTSRKNHAKLINYSIFFSKKQIIKIVKKDSINEKIIRNKKITKYNVA